MANKMKNWSCKVISLSNRKQQIQRPSSITGTCFQEAGGGIFCIFNPVETTVIDQAFY